MQAQFDIALGLEWFTKFKPIPDWSLAWCIPASPGIVLHRDSIPNVHAQPILNESSELLGSQLNCVIFTGKVRRRWCLPSTIHELHVGGKVYGVVERLASSNPHKFYRQVSGIARDGSGLTIIGTHGMNGTFLSHYVRATAKHVNR